MTMSRQTQLCIKTVLFTAIIASCWTLVIGSDSKGLGPPPPSTSVNCTSDCGNETSIGSESVNSEDEEPEPIWWCPTGYYLGRIRVCSQQSCLWITRSLQDGKSMNESTTNDEPSPNDIKTVTLQQLPDKKITCTMPSKRFNACWKIPLVPSQYVVLESNRSLWIPKAGATIPLGNFLILSDGIASVCRDDVVFPKVSPPPPPTSRSWYNEEFLNNISIGCMPFQVPYNDLGILPNGSALIINGTMSLRPTFYDTSYVPSNGTRNVCYELSEAFLTCKPKGRLFKGDFTLLPNMDVVEHLPQEDIIHPLGSYLFSLDGDVGYCMAPGFTVPMTDEKRYLYGVSFIVSSVFLFLTLMAHLLFPNLNYHAKALLCHILSMFIMYVSLSIQFIMVLYDWDTTACYVFFFITYVASLGAFFWLSVLAFDLWRVFANMRGTITPGGNQKEKRRFFCRCVYSWGIPAIMATIVLVIENSPDMQKSLQLVTHLEVTCWFIQEKAMFIFLYAPIVIILILNAIFFVLTVINLRQASKGTDVLNKKVSRQLFRVFVKLFVVMGIFWFAEVVSWLVGGHDRWYYATDLINALQGLAIFLVYICKRTTIVALKQKFGYGVASNRTSSTSSSGTKARKVSQISMNSVTRRGQEPQTNVTETETYRQTEYA